jgi:hypothetical protein
MKAIREFQSDWVDARFAIRHGTLKVTTHPNTFKPCVSGVATKEWVTRQWIDAGRLRSVGLMDV